MYYRETSGGLLGAYIQAACLMIQLKLERIPTDIYFDSMCLLKADGLAASPALAFWTQLISTFPEIEWHPVGEPSRSPKMIELRWKLNALVTGPTNEVKQHNSLQLAQSWKLQEGIDPVA